MFVLSFQYPNPVNRDFDYGYHKDVHFPLGIGLTDEHLNIKPKMVYIEKVEKDAGSDRPTYAVIGHVLFDKREDRDRFATLFDQPEAARRLSVDWGFYTEAGPDVRLSEWTGYNDMDNQIDTYKTKFRDLHNG